MRFSEILRRLDAYPRTHEDLSIRTFSGAAVTLFSSTLIVILIMLEFKNYLTPSITEELFVDTTRGHKLRINLDVTVANLACNFLSLDAMDSSGEQHLQIEHNIFKSRLDLKGNNISDNPIKEIVAATESQNLNKTCGSCYGAEYNSTHCCNTCDEVLEAYKMKRWELQLDKIEQCKGSVEKYKRSDKNAFKEGCRISGHIEVHRMSGSFHIAPGNSFSISSFHIHDFQISEFKLTHTINHLSFGEKIEFASTHPLDGLHTESEGDNVSEMYNYFLKIVPTVYQKLNSPPIYTNQFSVTRHKKSLKNPGERGMPGLFFTYELSPLMVKYTEKEQSLTHFAINVCSIVGGIFTVAGIIAALLQNSLERQKVELGKFS